MAKKGSQEKHLAEFLYLPFTVFKRREMNSSNSNGFQRFIM